jgi:hypothetical protein
MVIFLKFYLGDGLHKLLGKKNLYGPSPRAKYTERRSLVGEVSADFCGQRVPHSQRDGSLWPYSQFYRPANQLLKFNQTHRVAIFFKSPYFWSHNIQIQWAWNNLKYWIQIKSIQLFRCQQEAYIHIHRILRNTQNIQIFKISGPRFSIIKKILSDIYNAYKTNSMVWVRERTTPTERPPLVGEVIADFLWIEGARGQRDGSLRPYSRFSRQEPLLFYQVAPQLYSRGWVDPVPDPLIFFLVVPGIEPGPPDL